MEVKELGMVHEVIELLGNWLNRRLISLEFHWRRVGGTLNL